MRPMIGIVAAVALTASVAACASDPYYARSNYNYGYSAPGYTYSAPAYYRSPAYYQTTTYSYSSPQRGYSSYWDYQRNYRGIHSAPEL